TRRRHRHARSTGNRRARGSRPRAPHLSRRRRRLRSPRGRRAPMAAMDRRARYRHAAPGARTPKRAHAPPAHLLTVRRAGRGNGAADQHQLDVYGWVIAAAWLLVAAGHPLYSETWRAARGFADEVARRWHEPDAGIWEERGEPTHHVHSKLMAWLALDCTLRI